MADFDNDGDLDVFSGGGPLTENPPHKWFIWENKDGRGIRWIQQEILSGKRCHEAKAADVDGDGDIDICSKPWNGNEHVYLRNMLKEQSGNLDSRFLILDEHRALTAVRQVSSIKLENI